MLRLIRFLFTGDWHIHRYAIHKEFEGAFSHTIISKCQFCGKIIKNEVNIKV